jgi:hypothetical protein
VLTNFTELHELIAQPLDATIRSAVTCFSGSSSQITLIATSQTRVLTLCHSHRQSSCAFSSAYKADSEEHSYEL